MSGPSEEFEPATVQEASFAGVRGHSLTNRASTVIVPPHQAQEYHSYRCVYKYCSFEFKLLLEVV